MRFLLTSGGITNPSIAKAFLELIGKPAEETVLVFIPTAANVEEGDKSWLINDLYNLKKLNFKSVDIVDFSAVDKKVWQPRIEATDVLFFGGGNTFHLMKCLKDSGLAEMLPDLLKTRVYGGISAGSIVTGPTLSLSSQDDRLYYEKLADYRSNDALHFVDFHFRPHLNAPFFPNANPDYIKEVAKNTPEPIYALDDESALKVTDGKVEVVSEGKHIIFNQTL